MKRPRRLSRRKPIVVRGKPPISRSPRRWKALTLVWRTNAEKRRLSEKRLVPSVMYGSWSAKFAFHFNIAASFRSQVVVRGRAQRPPAGIIRRGPEAPPVSAWRRQRRLPEFLSRKVFERRIREAVLKSRAQPETRTMEYHRISRLRDLRLAEKERLFARSLRTIILRRGSKPVLREWRPRPEPIRHSRRSPQPINVEYAFAAPSVWSRRASVAPPLPLRSPELVWRTAPEATGADPVERIAGGPSAPLAAIASSAAAQLGQTQIAAADLRAPMIDAALMDRVAEDVIGRVERRMRIDRERRGI